MEILGGAERVQTANDTSIDFDEWAALARTDPRAFEARRLALIEQYLKQFPHAEQQRLRGIQFRIDMERRRARTPMAACVRLSGMMWDSLVGEYGLRNALDLFLNHSPATALARLRDRPSRFTAKIIAFPSPAR